MRVDPGAGLTLPLLLRLLLQAHLVRPAARQAEAARMWQRWSGIELGLPAAYWHGKIHARWCRTKSLTAGNGHLNRVQQSESPQDPAVCERLAAGQAITLSACRSFEPAAVAAQPSMMTMSCARVNGYISMRRFAARVAHLIDAAPKNTAKHAWHVGFDHRTGLSQGHGQYY